MARAYYDRLSAQDNTFLLGETPTSQMHVAGLQIFELGDLATEQGGVDFDRLRRATEAVLHRIPRYRQKLRWTPLTGNPVWVDDPDFRLEYHMRHTSLPRPGDLQQLRRMVGRIVAQPLDRERPLWETWIVEGLSGDRFALISKIHHCMIDGSSGVDLAQILLSVQPEKLVPEPVPYVPKAAPSGGELLRDEFLRRASLPLKLLRGVRALRQEADGLGSELGVRAKALGDLVGMALNPPSQTPLNGRLGPHRRFDWLRMPLEDVKAVRRAARCTVNDVVLTTATGAFREYLRRRNVDPGAIDFRASAPVSTRRAGDEGTLGNHVSSWMIDLPIGETTPAAQLAAIHAETRKLKESRQALGVELIMGVAEWTPPVLLSLGAQAVGGQVNTIITNVPGPQFPLYMQGARLLEMVPMVPLLPGMGLGIALFIYDGQLSWGFNADYALVPDLEVFVDLVRESFQAFAAAMNAEVQPPTASA